jgi:hypothetical protein
LTSQVRANSSQTYIPNKVDNFISKVQSDGLIKEALDRETSTKINHFNALIVEANQHVRSKGADSVKIFNDSLQGVFQLFDDDSVRSLMSQFELKSYVRLLNSAIFANRTTRLSGSKNRDKDQYNRSFKDDVALKSAVLNLADVIISGDFDKIISPHIITVLMSSMLQYQFYPEMINLWETGINSEQSAIYLSQSILAAILPVAYSNNRFTYEEILQIYELNVANAQQVQQNLLCSMGKISIMANDISRALDALEELLKLYENKLSQESQILASLCDLHLSFIGSCKDIKVSRHFFDKVTINRELPYNVVLKVPHVVSLLNNCYVNNEPLETILYFWKSTINHYGFEDSNRNILNSRYSILNNTMFQIFFKFYPELTSESFGKLREIIASYAEVRKVDETFLNTIINNYCWGNKEILEQLIDNYAIYGIERTPVSYRIALKKTGSLPDYTNEEILAKWNDSLKLLDDQDYKYIPIADWAAIRDATILSPYPERKQLYLSIVNIYKNYMQNKHACLRFIGNWTKDNANYPDIAKITSGNPVFDGQNDIVIPEFKNLRENVDYKQYTQDLVVNRNRATN